MRFNNYMQLKRRWFLRNDTSLAWARGDVAANVAAFRPTRKWAGPVAFWSTQLLGYFLLVVPVRSFDQNH